MRFNQHPTIDPVRNFIGQPLLLLALVWLLASPPASAAEPGEPKRLLLLHGGEKDAPANEVMDRIIKERLKADAGPVDIYSEYLDVTRFPRSHSAQLTGEFLREKYAGRRLDLNAERAADLALRTLSGDRSLQSPVVANGEILPMFDWRQLDRFGIGRDRLPPGSVVRYQQPSFWDAYKWRIIGVISLCIIEALLIVALLMQRISRRRAEEALRENEERLKLASSAAHIGAWDWRPRTGELKWSDEMRQIFGLADGKSDITTELFFDLIHPDDRSLVSQAITRTIKQGSPYDVEFRTVHRDGSVHWVMGKGKAVLDGAGQAVRMLGVNMDITVRKQAEDALRRSEARYRAIVEDQTEMICRLLPDGTLTFVNESYARYFERTPEELVGTSFRPFIPAEEEEHIRQFMASFSASNPVAMIEHRVMLPSGEVRWQQWTDRAIFDEQGRLIEFQCVGRDITPRKRMEQALRQSQRRYTLATAAGRVGLWDWNLETNDIYVDPELKALLGYRDDEIRNHMDDWGSHIHPEDREAVMAAATDLVESRSSSYEIEHRMLRRDGAICWFIARGTLVRGEDETRHIIGTKTDITARKQMEEALQRTEELNRAVLASLQHHIAVLDRDGQIIAVNETWKRFAAENGSPSSTTVGPGVNYLEICRKAIRESFPPAQRTLDGIVSVMNGFSDGYFEEYPCPFPSGVRWFLLSVVPLRRPEGGVVVSHINISERKHAEEALRRSEEALRDSHTRIKDLAGRLIIAQEEERKHIARDLHDDLNQQVAALAIGLSRLKRQLPSNDQALNEQIAKLEEKTNWLSDRIRRISHELHSAILQHIGLTAALKAYCAEFARQEGVAVSLDIQNSLEPIPPGLSLCLYRVVQESLRNIAKHSGAPSAEVKLADGRGTLELRITDRGVGFDLMQPGARSGLGLVSIEERVKMLQGSFQLKSQPGAGTELVVQIPLRS